MLSFWCATVLIVWWLTCCTSSPSPQDSWLLLGIMCVASYSYAPNHTSTCRCSKLKWRTCAQQWWSCNRNRRHDPCACVYEFLDPWIGICILGREKWLLRVSHVHLYLYLHLEEWITMSVRMCVFVNAGACQCAVCRKLQRECKSLVCVYVCCMQRKGRFSLFFVNYLCEGRCNNRTNTSCIQERR